MTSLLDLHPRHRTPALLGVVEIETALDRMLAGAASPLPRGEYAAALRSLERLGRRLEAVKLKVVAAADRAGAGQAAGFTGTEAWTARHTNTTRTTAAREVHLATELQTGHDTTAPALGLRHDTCAAEGCQRPYAWCELHHRKPWKPDKGLGHGPGGSPGGRTDLAIALPLCHYHHQRIHDPGYHHHEQPDRSIRFRRLS